MPYCKVCGYELLNPEDDLHDPEGLSDVAKEHIGGPNEAEDAHLIVRDGEKGWRYYCNETGKTTSIIPNPPGGEEDGEGQGDSPNEEAPQERPSPNRKNRGRIYDIPEQKSPTEVLAEVVTRPFVGLNEDQVMEIKDWAEDYDGQLPPDMLESILGNMNGVNKQTAALARQKYEVKLNAWVQEQAQGEDGPPIGITATPPSRSRRSAPQGPPRQREGSPPQESSQPPVEGSPPNNNGDIPTGDLREYRRARRTRRRNDALDAAAQTAAKQAADEVAKEFAEQFGFTFRLARRVLMRKAEKDPDWFLEKAEQWDIDILDEFLSPSQARQDEMGRGGPQVDRDVDDALEQTLKSEEIEHVDEQDFFDDDKEEIVPEEEGEMDDLFDDEIATQGGTQ